MFCTKVADKNKTPLLFSTRVLLALWFSKQVNERVAMLMFPNQYFEKSTWSSESVHCKWKHNNLGCVSTAFKTVFFPSSGVIFSYSITLSCTNI